MAIVPQDNQAFFREVDEALRRDRAEAFVLRWWRVGALLVVVLLLALAGGLAWRTHRASQAGQDAERLDGALAALGAGNAKAADQPLAELAISPRGGYRALAGLTAAGAAAEKGDLLGAIARYKLVADDATIAAPLRDAARVRQTALEYDMLPPAQVIARLAPLAKPGNPWLGSAGEMVAIADLRIGRRAEAGRLFAAIARDDGVADTLRSRAAQMASGLGVDPGLDGMELQGASGQ